VPNCPKCSADLSALDAHCPFCGSDRAQGNAFCPQCRADLVKVKRHCPFCGADLLEGTLTPKRPGGMGNALLLLGQIACVAGCAGIIMAIACSSRAGPVGTAGALAAVALGLALLVAFQRAKRLP